jgi:diguanylate cyclase (GGDEF)-like protein
MELDTRTAMVASLANAVLLGALALWLAGDGPRAAAIRRWGVAMLLFGLGFGGLALRGFAPGFVTIALANTLVLTSLAVGLRAIRMFCGVNGSDLISWVVVATVFLLTLTFARPETDYRLRVAVVSVAMATVMARAALTLHQNPPPEARRSYLFTEIVLWLSVAVALVRPLSVALEDSHNLMDSALPHVSVFLFIGVFVTALTFGFMWMANERLQGELAHLAAYDSLTEVLNRRAFLAQFEREASRSKREETVFSLAIFDLDRFKRINDEFGHPGGDRALQSVVATISGGIRKHDVLGRYGGEEFAVLMPNTTKDTAMLAAERIRAEVERHGFDIADRRITITVSGGVATYPLDGADWDALLTAADNALYDAKQGGRNRIVAGRAQSKRAPSG